MDDSGSIVLEEDKLSDVELILGASREERLAEQVFMLRDAEEALDNLFQRAAHESRVAENPRAVLTLLELGGLGVLKQIKVDTDLKSTPVVMLTSSFEKRDLLISCEHGTNDYIAKPVSFRTLIETVEGIGHFWGVVNQPPSQAEQCL